MIFKLNKGKRKNFERISSFYKHAHKQILMPKHTPSVEKMDKKILNVFCVNCRIVMETRSARLGNDKYTAGKRALEFSRLISSSFQVSRFPHYSLRHRNERFSVTFCIVQPKTYMLNSTNLLKCSLPKAYQTFFLLFTNIA